MATEHMIGNHVPAHQPLTAAVSAADIAVPDVGYNRSTIAASLRSSRQSGEQACGYSRRLTPPPVTELPFPISTVEEFAWLMKLVALLEPPPPGGGGGGEGTACTRQNSKHIGGQHRRQIAANRGPGTDTDYIAAVRAAYGPYPRLWFIIRFSGLCVRIRRLRRVRLVLAVPDSCSSMPTQTTRGSVAGGIPPEASLRARQRCSPSNHQGA
jgi:hypothetical protein